ncbi:MAG: hypothetical protein MEQ07_04510 [Aquimonas sp.]|nr:hypothetical protein [Aquimonas sp.]
MRILSADIQLSAAREFWRTELRSERLELQLGRAALPATPPPTSVQLSQAGRELAARAGTAEVAESAEVAPDPTRDDPNLAVLLQLVELLTGRPVRLFDAEVAESAEVAPDPTRDDPNLAVLLQLVELLTGRPVRLFDARELSAPVAAATGASAQAPARAPAQPEARAEADFSLDYQLRIQRSESEWTRVQAQGEILTTDGERIRFSLQLDMARSWREDIELRVLAGAAAERKDPLVINFGANAAQLRDQRFSFDLDADGRSELLPLLGGGSGMLTFDRNGDGRINDGRELFGALSGDGFADLAALDADGNGWIDRSDSAFGQLRVWVPGAEGESRLLTLEQAGVAAISLTRVESPFDLRGTANADLGQIRSAGLYLTTAREVRTLQQIDFSV